MASTLKELVLSWQPEWSTCHRGAGGACVGESTSKDVEPGDDGGSSGMKTGDGGKRYVSRGNAWQPRPHSMNGLTGHIEENLPLHCSPPGPASQDNNYCHLGNF